MTTAIIIPVREITKELREALTHIRQLQPAASEVIVFTDQLATEFFPGVRLIPTGPVSPAEKRDRALQYTNSDLLAFLDDDAYPPPSWLLAIQKHFVDPQIAAVGGPAITPRHDGFWALVSGAVLTSWIGSGPARMRYWPVGDVRPIDDWPSVNLVVRRSVFAELGGFGTNSWPGEDTKLCLNIVQKGYRILYDPAAYVYHHRATTLVNHLRQIARYGLHRGYFAKRYPATSRRPSYYLPSLGLALLLVGILAFIFMSSWRPALAIVAVVAALLTLISALIESFRIDRPSLLLLMPPTLLATHSVYGFAFIRGLLSPSLKRYQRRGR